MAEFDIDSYAPVKEQSVFAAPLVRQIAAGVFFGLFAWSLFCALVYLLVRQIS